MLQENFRTGTETPAPEQVFRYSHAPLQNGESSQPEYYYGHALLQKGESSQQEFRSGTARWEALPGLTMYLLINSLFLLKYVSRSSFPEWASVVVYSLFIISLVSMFRLLPERFFKPLYFTVAAGMLAGILLLHRTIDPLTVQVDRWSAIDHFLERMLKGEYPYMAQTHLGGYGSPFPFWNLFHLPYYLLGDVAIVMLAVLIALIFSLKRITENYTGAALFLVLLAVSPAFWYEVAVRSDLLYNFLLCFLIITWWYRRGINIGNSLWTTALVSGLMLSTRLSIVIPFFLYLFPGFILAGWKQRLLFTGIAALCFLLTFLPFMVWDLNQLVFFEYNPFVLQTRQGSPLELLVLAALLVPFSLLWKGNTVRYATFTYLTIVVFVSVTFIHRMFTDNFESELFSSRYDITYFNMSLPFVLWVISRSSMFGKTNAAGN